MIMPPHPTLSREGRGNKVTPQQSCEESLDSKSAKYRLFNSTAALDAVIFRVACLVLELPHKHGPQQQNSRIQGFDKLRGQTSPKPKGGGRPFHTPPIMYFDTQSQAVGFGYSDTQK